MEPILVRIKSTCIFSGRVSGDKWVYNAHFSGYPEPTLSGVTVLMDDNSDFIQIPFSDFEVINEQKHHSINDCANIVKMSLCGDLVNEAKLKPNVVPMMDSETKGILDAITHVEKHITEDWYKGVDK